MENLLDYDHWKIDIENTVTFLLDKFRKREEDLMKAKNELESARQAFDQEMKLERARFEKEVSEKNKELEKAREKFEDEKTRMNDLYEIQSSHVKLDVGGHIFSTSLTTLTRDKNSMLAAMFSGRHQLVKLKGKDNTFFIDRDGTHFRHILNYLRDDLCLDTLPQEVTILKEIQREADYYQLSGLFDMIQSIITPLPILPDYSQANIDCLFNKVIKDLTTEPNNQKIMTKSCLDFKKKNLSGLSFIHTTFVHNVSFTGSILRDTTFYGCEFGGNVNIDFTNADLTAADFRQCRAFTAVLPTNGQILKPPLYGTSCSSFLHLIQDKKVVFQGANLNGTKFDPGVLECILQISKID